MTLRRNRLIGSLLLGFMLAFLTWAMIGDHPNPGPIGTELGWLGQTAIILLLPGFLSGFAISGNVHVANTWVIVLVNFVFYFGLAYLVGTFWEKRHVRLQEPGAASPMSKSSAE